MKSITLLSQAVIFMISSSALRVVLVDLNSRSLAAQPKRLTFFHTSMAAAASCGRTGCGAIPLSGIHATLAALSTTTVTDPAVSQPYPTESASASVNSVSAVGSTYYLAPANAGGRDSNNGLSPDAPWLTPNHPLKCGDVIIAVSSNAYSPRNFHRNFGKVYCPAGNNVAWLKCAKFDTCLFISASSSDAIWINQSYWGVQGFEFQVGAGTSSTAFGINASPFGSSTNPVNHIIFANNIVNGASGGGLGTSSLAGSGMNNDYLVMIGNIITRTGEGNVQCWSGLDPWEPEMSDSLPGTHVYLAGNFSFGNINPSTCNSAAPTDGEGIILDTWNAYAYTAQTVVENNMLLSNGGRGFAITQNNGKSPGLVIVRHNTTWGNSEDSNQRDWFDCGEVGIQASADVVVYSNLSVTSAATGCQGNAIWGIYVVNTKSSQSKTIKIYNNDAYSPWGNNYGISNSPGFAFGSGNISTNPSFANPKVPTLPTPRGKGSCSGYADVPACMATVVANFTPTNRLVRAGGYGYHPPSSTPVYDPLFPLWLCGVTNMPPGLITMGCRPTP